MWRWPGFFGVPGLMIYFGWSGAGYRKIPSAGAGTFERESHLSDNGRLRSMDCLSRKDRSFGTGGDDVTILAELHRGDSGTGRRMGADRADRPAWRRGLSYTPYPRFMSGRGLCSALGTQMMETYVALDS